MMATKKVGGSVKNGRDSAGRRLGVKVNHGQSINSGAIIIRQRGKRYKCGKYAYYGKDHTIHAKINGIVNFYRQNNQVYICIA